MARGGGAGGGADRAAGPEAMSGEAMGARAMTTRPVAGGGPLCVVGEIDGHVEVEPLALVETTDLDRTDARGLVRPEDGERLAVDEHLGVGRGELADVHPAKRDLQIGDARRCGARELG